MVKEEVCKKCGKLKPELHWCDICADIHPSVANMLNDKLCDCYLAETENDTLRGFRTA
jgi:hypothetical protein